MKEESKPWIPSLLIYKAEKCMRKNFASIAPLFVFIVIHMKSFPLVPEDIKRLKVRKIWIFHYEYDDGKSLLASFHCIYHEDKLFFFLSSLHQFTLSNTHKIFNDCGIFLPASCFICLMPRSTPSTCLYVFICVKHDNKLATKMPWEHNKV